MCARSTSIIQVSLRHVDVGIGNLIHIPTTLSKVDYMSWVDQFEFVMISMNPREVVSYDTIIRPFDLPSWCLLGKSTLVMIMVLILINMVTGQSTTLYKCELMNLIHIRQINMINYFPAIRFPISILLQEDVPVGWYQLKEGHYAQVIAMGMWLMVATIISLAYTSQLLSSLTAKE